MSDLPPDPMRQEGRLAMVRLVREIGDVYKPEGVGVFLFGRHKLLDDRRPLDVIADDEDGFDRVAAIVDQLRSGAFL